MLKRYPAIVFFKPSSNSKWSVLAKYPLFAIKKNCSSQKHVLFFFIYKPECDMRTYKADASGNQYSVIGPIYHVC